MNELCKTTALRHRRRTRASYNLMVGMDASSVSKRLVRLEAEITALGSIDSYTIAGFPREHH